MWQQGDGLNIIHFNVGVNACVKGNNWVLPLKLLKEARQWDLKPDVVSYSIASSACEKGAEWLLPFELLEDMQQ